MLQRSFLLVFQQIIDHLDNDIFENQDTRTSLTIHVYLNRPTYDSMIDLSIIERNFRRLLYHFLPLPIYDLFEIFTIQVHFEVCQPYHVERVEITEYLVVI